MPFFNRAKKITTLEVLMWSLAERLDELKVQWRLDEGGPYAAHSFERFLCLLEDNWEAVLAGLRAMPAGPERPASKAPA